MSLKSVCARVCTTGSSPTLELVHKETGEVIQTFRLVKADREHKSFILSTWLRSYRPTARKRGFSEFFGEYEGAIAESRWEDAVVATDESGFTVYAWVCAYPGELHYVYVGPELRGIGVAKGLIHHVAGQDYVLARPWPGTTHHKLNPYLMVKKHV